MWKGTKDEISKNIINKIKQIAMYQTLHLTKAALVALCYSIKTHNLFEMIGNYFKQNVVFHLNLLH